MAQQHLAHHMHSPSPQRPPPNRSFPVPSNASHTAKALTYGQPQAQHAPGHPAYQPVAPSAVGAPYAYSPVAAAASAGQVPVVQYAYVQVICFASLLPPLHAVVVVGHCVERVSVYVRSIMPGQ